MSMKKNFLGFTILTGSILLAGCGPDSTSKIISFEPSSLVNCENASEVVVKWDVRTAFPEVHTVQIFVNDGASETLFVEGTSLGSYKTGQWVRPGKPRFVLKDKVTGKVLGDGVVNGPVCR